MLNSCHHHLFLSMLVALRAGHRRLAGGQPFFAALTNCRWHVFSFIMPVVGGAITYCPCWWRFRAGLSLSAAVGPARFVSLSKILEAIRR
jgi:hypothetical protein